MEWIKIICNMLKFASYILTLALVAILLQINEASGWPIWTSIFGGLSTGFNEFTNSPFLKKIDTLAAGVVVAGIALPFLFGWLWKWLSIAVKEPTMHDNMRVWTGIFVVLTAINFLVLAFAFHLFHRLGCGDDAVPGCTAYDALGVSVAAIEVSLVILTLGGFWLVRKLTKDEARKVAKAETKEIAEALLKKLLTPEIVAAAIASDSDLINTTLDLKSSGVDFQEEDEYIPETNGTVENSPKKGGLVHWLITRF